MTILGIVAAIAIPLYQDYRTRTIVAEGLQLAGPVKLAIELQYSSSGSLPTSNEEAGLDPVAEIKANYVQSIEVTETGAVVIHLKGSTIGGNTLTLTPSAAGAVSWTCSSSLPNHFVPANCRSVQ